MKHKRTYIKDGGKRVLSALMFHKWLSPAEIAERTGLDRARIRNHIHALKKAGLVEVKGLTRAVMYRRTRTPTTVKFAIEMDPSYELQSYFKLPTKFVTVNEYAVISNIPVGSAYRFVKRWIAQKLVELSENRPLLQSGKRAIHIKRIYNAVTFNAKGEVVVERVDLNKPFG